MSAEVSSVSFTLQFHGDQRPDPEECSQFWFLSPYSPVVRRVHVLPDRAQSGTGERRDPHRCHGRGTNTLTNTENNCVTYKL